MKGKPCAPPDLSIDIRKNSAWQQGYVDTFVDGYRANDDPCDELLDWFAGCTDVVAGEQILTDEQWLIDVDQSERRAIVLGEDSSVIANVAARWLAIPIQPRPLLLHAYFPRGRSIDFAAFGLPRPMPILPALIRSSVYVHAPQSGQPSTSVQVELLVNAIQILRRRAET